MRWRKSAASAPPAVVAGPRAVSGLVWVIGGVPAAGVAARGRCFGAVRSCGVAARCERSRARDDFGFFFAFYACWGQMAHGSMLSTRCAIHPCRCHACGVSFKKVDPPGIPPYHHDGITAFPRQHRSHELIEFEVDTAHYHTHPKLPEIIAQLKSEINS